MTDVTTRRRALIELCRYDGGVGRGPDWLRHLDDPDWRRAFVALAKQHHVLGLAVLRLLGPEGDRPYDDLAQLLKKLRLRASVLQLRFDHVLETLASAGLMPVVLKGAVIARTVYREPSERDIADLDLLVPKPDLERALNILIHSGYRLPPRQLLQRYREAHFHVPLNHPVGHRVEVHWALTQSDSAFQLDSASVLDQATRITLDGREVRVPRPEHMLLHQVVQNLQEGFCRLGRIVDLDRIVRGTGVEWAFVTLEARAGRLESATALSLQLAHRLLGSEIPDDALTGLLPKPLARFHLALMRPELFLFRRDVDRAATRDLLDLWLLEDRRERRRELRRRLDGSYAPLTSTAPPSFLGQAARLAKIALAQAGCYLRAAIPVGDHGRRGPIRFWSSQASNSDLL